VPVINGLTVCVLLCYVRDSLQSYLVLATDSRFHPPT
jgi:hypothetical protein